MFKPIIRNATTGQELLWLSIKLKKSMDEICHILELEIPPSERLKVRKHHRLQVCGRNPLDIGFGGERCVSTVLVDEITAIAENDKRCIMVIGRSPARDIIDSTWSDQDDGLHSYVDKTLEDIVTTIGRKFGITCAVFDGPTKPVCEFAFENESPWTKLLDEADQQGYVLTSNEIGNLYLWKVPPEGANRREFHITEGVNIKNIKWTENGSEQFRNYIVKGGVLDSVHKIDYTCPGNRILTIDITDPWVSEEELERRAETEKNRRSETKTIVTVSGWGLTDEQIKRLGNTNGEEIYWYLNTLIPVKVPTLGLDASLLVSEVEYLANKDTISCDITLVNRGMYL